MLSIRLCHNKSLPCNDAGLCLTEEDAAAVFEMGHFEYQHIYSDEELTRLQMGVFVFRLKERMARTLVDEDSGGETKLWLYSGHDGTVAPLLGALGVGNRRWPGFGSTVILELWALDGVRPSRDSAVVRVLVNGSPELLPGCDDQFCPFSSFEEPLESLRPESIIESCMDVRSPAAVADVVGAVNGTVVVDGVLPLYRGHCHNCYHHDRPLLDALENGFCSIEADFFLTDLGDGGGERLYVAHNFEDITSERTLEAMYIRPLAEMVAASKTGTGEERRCRL